MVPHTDEPFSKRRRRNAIRSNSTEADILREFAVNHLINNLIIDNGNINNDNGSNISAIDHPADNSSVLSDYLGEDLFVELIDINGVEINKVGDRKSVV